MGTNPTRTTTGGAPAGDGITVYGADWCGDSRRSQRLLDRFGVPYTFIDVEEDEAAAAWVRTQNRGYRSTPTIALGASGPVLVEPSDGELLTAVREAGLLAVERATDERAAD